MWRSKFLVLIVALNIIGFKCLLTRQSIISVFFSYCLYGDMFFLLSHFLVVEDYELSKSSFECIINSGIRQNSNLIHLFFLYFNCLPDDVLCKLFELVILVSTHHVTNHLTYHNKLSCNLILKIKIVGIFFYFSSATFLFWGVKI